MSPTPPASMTLLNTVHAHLDSLGLPRVTHMFGTPPPSPGQPKAAPSAPPAPASYPSSPYLASPAPAAPARSASPGLGGSAAVLPAPVSATHAPTGLARFSTRLTTRWAILAVCALALLTLVHLLLFIDGAPLAQRDIADDDVRTFKAARLGQLEPGVKVAPNGWVGPMRGGLPIHAQRARNW